MRYMVCVATGVIHCMCVRGSSGSEKKIEGGKGKERKNRANNNYRTRTNKIVVEDRIEDRERERECVCAAERGRRKGIRSAKRCSSCVVKRKRRR